MRLLYIAALALSVVFFLNQSVAQHTHTSKEDQKQVASRAPLLKDIGDLHHAVSTKNKLAQRYFDQGLTMLYGFNHLEAERSFAHAAKEDPKLAMAWWGQALALGSNINDPITANREKKAVAALQKSQQLKKYASPAERAYIDALAVRYSPRAGVDRPALDKAYAAAMKKVATRFPNDADAQTLYADAVMNTMPWDYYDANGAVKPEMAEVIATLERVIARWPNHAGANHLYIHAVEASHDPDRGLASANRLETLVPAAGHLVHMPAHIYIRTGKYAAASKANERAVAADESYITQCRAQGIYPLGYFPHNLHFLAVASMMEGRSEAAIRAADETANRVRGKTLADGVPPWGSVFISQPILARVRFGRWDEVLATPDPGRDNPYAQALWHYARGIASVRKGSLAEAEGRVGEVKAAAQDPQLKEYLAGANPAPMLLSIAANVLEGEILGARKDFDGAIQHLQEAIAIQDKLRYNEPEDWYYPVRQTLGAMMLKAGRAQDAERVYREDLKRNRDNGWSLFGLAESLRQQGRAEEAAAVDSSFASAWKRADVKLVASHF